MKVVGILATWTVLVVMNTIGLNMLVETNASLTSGWSYLGVLLESPLELLALVGISGLSGVFDEEK